MNYNLSSFVQTKNNKWKYRHTTACFAWYPWEETIKRIVYPLTVNKSFDPREVSLYLQDIRNDLPDGLSFTYDWTEDKNYLAYWQGDGSQLLMVDIRLDGVGHQKHYALTLLCMLRYLREKPEIPYFYLKHRDQWPKHWGMIGILNYIQMKYKEIGQWTRPGYQYGHALMERASNSFCRNWEEFSLRKAMDPSNQISTAMHGGSANVKEITFELVKPKDFVFVDITHENNNPNFPKRAFPEFDIPEIQHENR